MKLQLLKTCIVSITLSIFTTATAAAPGYYDTAFGSNGVALRNIGPGHDVARAVAIQPDGKIVLAGGCSKTVGNGGRGWCVGRFTANGLSDSSFAGTGNVQIDAATDQYAAGVAVLPNNDIIIAGTCEQKFCLYRLSPSGGVYTNFGDMNPSGGRATFMPLGVIAVETRTVLVQPDGRIVVGGQCYDNASIESICIARFNANGSVDTSFGHPMRGVQFGFFAGQIYRLGGLALQGDGKIVYSASLNISGYNFTRGRLNANGAFDNTWQTGVIAAVGTTNNIANAIVLQADGKAMIGGFCTIASNQRFCVTRVRASDGSLDTSYASNGFYVAPLTVLGGGNGVSLAMQSDGRAILSGTWSGSFSAIRLNDDGSLDTSWGSSGVTYGTLNNGDQLYASALQRDGKLLWVGQCTLTGTDPQFCVQRVDGGPFGFHDCSLDLDGDGRVLPHTDALIATRIAQGIRNSAAVGGIVFSGSATRTNWSSIRDYLNVQCKANLQ